MALAVAWGLTGCGSSHPAPSAHPPAAAFACAEIAGEEKLTAPLLLIGDIHGTREIPAAFGDLVCHAASAHRGQTILAGLEIPADEQAAIDTFLAGAGDAAAIQALLAGGFWRRDYQDGRSSAAMLSLLDELRRQKKAGLRIVVRGIDLKRYDSADDRDAGMAANVEAAIDAVHPAQTLVLTGNVHTRTLHGYPWDAKADYVPMGAHLRAKQADLIALDIKSLGGSAWMCASADPKECGPHDLRPREPNGPTPRVELAPDAAATLGYDGALLLGPLTASSPARSLTPQPLSPSPPPTPARERGLKSDRPEGFS
ncbi:MAG: hypothetical protein DMF53_19450 [Acidobacteria bacterium]|nr:MAG: hypothetical protein DMF53_19450 [Acidobacteriota bacterium]